jgi:biopolymer transport protein ExbD
MTFKTENKVLSIFNFSSLTDIVLLLLIFFLLSSSFVLQTGIKVQLPKAEAAETQSPKNIIITLTEAGKVYLNADEVTVSTLGQKLLPLVQKESDQVVVIKADRSVSLQRTVEVIDVAKAVGAAKFLIATVPR